MSNSQHNASPRLSPHLNPLAMLLKQMGLDDPSHVIDASPSPAPFLSDLHVGAHGDARAVVSVSDAC